MTALSPSNFPPVCLGTPPIPAAVAISLAAGCRNFQYTIPASIHTTVSTTSPPSASAVSSRSEPRHCVQRRSLVRKEQPRPNHPASEGIETRAGGMGSVALSVPQRASIHSRRPCNGDTSLPRGKACRYHVMAYTSSDWPQENLGEMVLSVPRLSQRHACQ